MHERGGLERVPRLLTGHLRAGERAQLGRNQEFLNLEGTLHRWDARLDHELGRNDSLFVRFSWQHRNPGTTFEDTRFPLLGVLDRTLDARTAVGSWVRIFSSGALNELRAGYNVERNDRRSRYRVGEVSATLGLIPPAGSADRRGYPAFSFSGPNSISSVTDDWNRANRDIEQASLSLSDTFTWLTGRHSLKIGGLYSRDTVTDGFATSVSSAAGSFVFNGSRTGNSLADLLLGLPSQARAGQTARGLRPLDASSQVFAAFAQDDWKVSDRLTLFFGLRYEVTTPFVERDDLLANFDAESARVVVPGSGIAPLLALDPEDYPSVVASELGLGRSLLRRDDNNLSPRAGFAWRLDGANKTVLRGGFGLFYPTAAAQGIRDLLSRTAFSSFPTYSHRPWTTLSREPRTARGPATPIVTYTKFPVLSWI